MMLRITRVVTARRIGILLALGALPSAAIGQDRLKTMPGYEQYARVAPQIAGSVKLGTLQTFWIEVAGRSSISATTRGTASTSPPGRRPK